MDFNILLSSVNMNSNQHVGSQLPKINLKKFDYFTQNIPKLTSNFQTQILTSPQQPKHKNILFPLNNYSNSNLNSKDKKSFTLSNHPQLKYKYQSKSLSFHKSQFKKQSNQIPIQTHKIEHSPPNILLNRSNLKMIDSAFILDIMPKIKMSKSQPKIQILNRTNYEQWFPKKNNHRQIETIRNQNNVKTLKFQDSFFFKSRNTSCLLKLSTSEQIKK